LFVIEQWVEVSPRTVAMSSYCCYSLSPHLFVSERWVEVGERISYLLLSSVPHSQLLLEVKLLQISIT